MDMDMHMDTNKDICGLARHLDIIRIRMHPLSERNRTCRWCYTPEFRDDNLGAAPK